jgi:DNA-binding Xre family transcriptional regulator
MKATLRVKELVDERGWNVRELARQADLDPETAQSMYEGRSTEMELSALSRLSEVLGVLPDEIVASVEEKQPSAQDAPAPRSIDTSEEDITHIGEERGTGETPDKGPPRGSSERTS